MTVVNLNLNTNRAFELESRLVGLSADEPILTSNYTVKGWLDRNCLPIIYRQSNSGKTFVALDLAAHIAVSKP